MNTLKAKDSGHKNFGQNIFGRLFRNIGRIPEKLFRTFPEKFWTNKKTIYLVIFNALKRYLKVNSFKFV